MKVEHNLIVQGVSYANLRLPDDSEKVGEYLKTIVPHLNVIGRSNYKGPVFKHHHMHSFSAKLRFDDSGKLSLDEVEDFIMTRPVNLGIIVSNNATTNIPKGIMKLLVQAIEQISQLYSQQLEQIESGEVFYLREAISLNSEHEDSRDF